MIYYKEPFRLTRWMPKGEPLPGQFFTCARPGRPIGSKKKVPDQLVDAWVKGLPASEDVIIVSLLGRKPKPNDISEFSFYSFRGGYDTEAERPGCLTFQEWLNHRNGNGRFRVLEFPTIDTEPIPHETLSQLAATIISLLREGQTVVLMDSGGIGRTGRVCKYLNFCDT